MTEQGAVALVTGAGQGIGREIAIELGRRGYMVVANDLRHPHETLRELRDMGAHSLPAPCDVADEEAVTFMVTSVFSAVGHVDVLVNNAGISFQRRAEET
ncbi:MAG TPA: SDR family NAD(P)-dependent oxidoreductase, partial [Chloroflexota bacterium]